MGAAMNGTTVRTICECGHEGGHRCPLDWSQAARSVRRNAAIWAAAYREAADELRTWAADGLLNAAEYGSHENVLDAADRLRARADQMGQQ
jgi:hypothetical protein